jgi:hypothetical protein
MAAIEASDSRFLEIKEDYYYNKFSIPLIDNLGESLELLERLSQASSFLLEEADPLRPYWKSGDDLGALYEKLMNEGSGGLISSDQRREPIERICSDLGRLSGLDAPGVKRNLGLVLRGDVPAREDGPVRTLDDDVRSIDLIDRYVQLVLRNRAYPDPVLVLDTNFILLHDIKIDYRLHRDPGFPILWVLAEHLVDPSRIQRGSPPWLSSREIVERLPYHYSLSSVPSVISRFRENILRPAIRAYYQRSKIQLDKNLNNTCYIAPPPGWNARRYKEQPYQIHLEPEQVVILSNEMPDFSPPKDVRGKRKP